jgi:threonine synthase
VDEVQADTIADSISVDQPRDGLAAAQAIIESGGEAITLPDQNILAAISEMARFTGLFVEPAAAAPWAAVRQMADDRLIDADERVICLVTGSGLKDPASAGKAFGEPALIVPTVDAVSRFCTSLL